MKNIYTICLISLLTNTCSMRAYEHKLVDEVGSKKPHVGYVAADRAKVYFTNKTGHTVKEIKTIFRFDGRRELLHHKYVYGEQQLGQITTGPIPNNKTVIVSAVNAISSEEHIRPFEHFGMVENIVVLCVGNDMYTHHLLSKGAYQNHFVLTRFGSKDVVETQKHYKHRMRKFREIAQQR